MRIVPIWGCGSRTALRRAISRLRANFEERAEPRIAVLETAVVEAYRAESVNIATKQMLTSLMCGAMPFDYLNLSGRESVQRISTLVDSPVELLDLPQHGKATIWRAGDSRGSQITRRRKSTVGGKPLRRVFATRLPARSRVVRAPWSASALIATAWLRSAPPRPSPDDGRAGHSLSRATY
jgi:hypothetical protein